MSSEFAVEMRDVVKRFITPEGHEMAAVDHVTAVRRVLVDVVEPGDWEALGRAMKAVLAVADSDT